MSLYVDTPAPHIRTADTVGAYYWGRTVALIPAVAVASFQGRLSAVSCVTALFTACLAEILGAALAGRRAAPEDGAGVFYTLLGLLLLPANLPAGSAVVAAFLIVAAGKEFFGGLGGFFLHPSLLGTIVLAAMQGLGSNSFPTAGTNAVAWALIAGSGLLFFRRQGAAESQAAYFLPLILGAPFLGLSIPELLLNQGALLCGIFALTDVSLLPFSHAARRLVPAAAALATLFLAASGVRLAPVYGILMANLITPWFDMIPPHAVRKA